MAANSKAKFYYRSFIDQDVDGYALSGDFTPTASVNDRRKSTYAETDTTGTGDGTSEEFIADMLTERTIDTIFLKSNLKTFNVWMWSENETGTGGEGWELVTAYTVNAAPFLCISFDDIVTSKIKIEATHTITANEVKKIYLLEITQLIGELNVEKSDIVQKYERESWRNIYGGSVQVVQYPNRGKTEIALSWSNMTAADYAVYSAIKAQTLIDAVLIYFYFSDDFDLMDSAGLYLVNDLEEKEATPSAETASAGVSGKMKLVEC